MKKWIYIIIVFGMGYGCGSNADPDVGQGSLVSIPYAPSPYILTAPDHYPQMAIPADNPLTIEGVELGRHLFYDPILSKGNRLSCSSCHLPEGNFTDNLATSPGVDGIRGRRSSMSLLNVGYNTNGFFWDGRTQTLEEQALHPIEDPIEFNTTWEEVESKLQSHPTYPEMFRKAFGITRPSEISRDLAAKALAQFERTLISSGQSKYDQVISGDEIFTDLELRGHNIFFDIEPDATKHAECGHCHNAPLFTTNEFTNNGLDDTDNATLTDLGKEEVTGLAFDRGSFRIPTLINIESSAPFMHDGRFETLDQVIDHYVSGGHPARNLDPLIRPLDLSDRDRSALVAFIKTLKDPSFMSEPMHQSPF
ncbi:MAG: cytochrome c peroxidase [Bacteroidota bacterium]